jgi:glycosyltransferase involved in cell wall biosynthesis
VNSKEGQFTVSAIVSTYNSERFIRGCLEDLLSQSIADRLEIIVVDSASSQNEKAIVEEFQKRCGNIKYIRTEERETIYVAWNRGIQSSSGKYITNANTDDRHRSDAFERMVGVMEEWKDISLVYADSYVTIEENMTFGSAHAVSQLRWPDFDAQLLFRMCYVGPQPMWRRDLHMRHGYFDPEFQSAGDYEFWLRIAATEKFYHMNEFLGLYLLSPTGIERRNEMLSYRESEKARERHWPAIRGKRPEGLNRDDRRLYNRSEPEPVVTVIVPTCNRPDMLVVALNSIFTQTYENYEVVVVNDGGEDVAHIIAPFEKLGCITCIRTKTRKGPAAARNLGLQKARGKYIAYLDDDDIFYPDHLETLVNFLEDNNYHVAYSDSCQAFQEMTDDRYVTKHKALAYGYDFNRENFLIKDYIPILTVMHRRECINEVGGFDESLGVHEDWDLWIRMSRRHDFHHVRKVTAEFRTRESSDSITSKDFQGFLQGMKEIHSRYAGYVSDPKTEKAQKTIVSLHEAKIEQGELVRIYPAKSAPDSAETIDSKVSVVIPLPDGSKGSEMIAGRIASQRKIKDVETVNLSYREDNLGTSLNKAIAECTGEYIVLVSPDVVPAGSYWLYAMTRPFRDHPELAALSCRQLFTPETDLFNQWMSRSHEQSQYFRSDSISVLSGGPKGAKWIFFDKEIKKRLSFFNGRAACLRKDILDEMHFNDLEDAGETFIDFGIQLMEKGKALGYIVSAGVLCENRESASESLKRSYSYTKKLHDFMNGLPYFFYINNLNSEVVRANILSLYHLINTSAAGVEESGSPVKAARSFIDNIRENVGGLYHVRGKHGTPDTSLEALLNRLFGTDDLDLRGAGDLKNNFLLSGFMKRFERFSEHLCTAQNDLTSREGEIVPCIYNIFAGLAGEVLGAYCLEADGTNGISENVEQLEAALR